MDWLEGKVCVVTGANAGIGREIARGLAARGGHVVLACRSEQRGTAAVQEIRRGQEGARVELGLVDLSTHSSVRAFAATLLEQHPKIHVLVNNAGIWSSYRQETADGIERTWATNVLGSFLLTELLTPALVRAAPARVVNVASGLARDLDLTDVGFERRRYDGVTAYAQSKQANRMLTWAWARHFAGTGVTANALHPGFTRTGAFGKGGGVSGRVAALGARLFGRSPASAADTALWLATSAQLATVTGGFWKDRRPLDCPFRDPDREEALASLCERMTCRVPPEVARAVAS